MTDWNSDIPLLRYMTSENVNPDQDVMAEILSIADTALTDNPQKISVIMPVWNRLQVVGAAIDSILRQSYLPFEILIMDDGSSDGSADYIADSYADEIASGIIKLFRQSNQGMAKSRNTLLTEVTGELVAYLDSDNIWRPDYLKVMASLFTGSDALDVAYCGLRVINRDAGITFQRSQRFDRRELLDTNFIDVNVVMHRLRMFETHGGFSEELTRLTDWDLMLRYTKIQEPAFVHFWGGDYFLDSKNLRNIGYMSSYEENLEKIYDWNREERDALGLNDGS
jgi:glycosyltransferase involved in cell wall biosynthesis